MWRMADNDTTVSVQDQATPPSRSPICFERPGDRGICEKRDGIGEAGTGDWLFGRKLNR